MIFILFICHIKQGLTLILPVKHLAPEKLKQARRRAVQMRLSGHTLADTATETGLSVPTIIKVFKAFESGGWAAIKPAQRGRKAGEGSGLSTAQQQRLRERLLQPPPTGLWSREAVVAEVEHLLGQKVSERAVSRLLDTWHLNGPALKVRKPKGVRNPAARWYKHQYEPLLSWARQQGANLLLACCQVAQTAPDTYQLCLQTTQRKQLWLESSHWPTESWLIEALERLLVSELGPVAVCLSGLDLSRAHQLHAWLDKHGHLIHLISVPVSVELESA